MGKGGDVLSQRMLGWGDIVSRLSWVWYNLAFPLLGAKFLRAEWGVDVPTGFPRICHYTLYTAKNTHCILCPLSNLDIICTLYTINCERDTFYTVHKKASYLPSLYIIKIRQWILDSVKNWHMTLCTVKIRTTNLYSVKSRQITLYFVKRVDRTIVY